MSKERSILLAVLFIAFVGIGGWLIVNAVTEYQTTFIAGAPPKDLNDVIVPQQLDLAQLHPPALQGTDTLRWGSPTSTIAIIEYGDYDCESCRQMEPVLKQIVLAYGGTVRFIWKDLIDPQHANALPAAIFAYCAGAQGKFWEAHDALMAAAKLNELTYQSIASSLQLDGGPLLVCRHDAKVAAGLQQQTDVAQGDGISSSPILFVGTKAFQGAVSATDIQNAITSFLAN